MSTSDKPSPSPVPRPYPLAGLWQGYDGEWGHVSRLLVALADAIPAEKFTWRPAPGVLSTSEVGYGAFSIRPLRASLSASPGWRSNR